MINPGGGVSWWTEVPGLQIELTNAVTNIVNGGTTGTGAGSVIRTSPKTYEIKFPYSIVSALSNDVIGSFYIDPSGTTTVTYLPGFAFPSLPHVDFTIRDTNANLVATPNIINLDSNTVTVVFLSSGDLVTNYWRVDYEARYGLSYGVAGNITSISGLTDGTNVYRRDGTYPMSAMKLSSGALADSWLAGDAVGNGTWQSKTAANLSDYSDLFLKDGSRAMTGALNMGSKNITSAASVYGTAGYFSSLYVRYLSPPAPGYVLSSAVGGECVWLPPADSVAHWYHYTAAASVNMGGYDLNNAAQVYAVGEQLGASGLIITTGQLTMNSGTADFQATGGGYAAAKFKVHGVSQLYDLAYFDNGIYCKGNSSYGGASYYAGNGGHILAEGGIYSGAYAWLGSWYTHFAAGVLASQNGIYVVNGNYGASAVFSVNSAGVLYAAGTKSFRIQHPVDTNKYLYHASAESPNPELIYRGKSTLVDGAVVVNLNTYYGLIPTTLDTILTNIQVHVDNNTSWTRVRCVTVSGVGFRIESETPCNDEVQWIAIGRRCDAGVANYRIEVDK